MKKRKKVEHALQISKDLAINIIDTVNVMVIGFDLNGHISVFNQAAEKITGYTHSDLENRNWFDFIIPHDRYPEAIEKFKQLITYGFPKNFESPILTKTGEERYITWQSSEMDKQNQALGFISFGIDITERRQHERELEIITTVSSALRTPQTLSDIFQVALTQLMELFKTNSAAIATSNIANEKIHYEVLGEDFSRTFFDQIFVNNGDLNFIINDYDVYLNNDIQRNLQLSKYDQLMNMHALVCISLIAHGNKTGYMIIIRKEVITNEDMHILNAIADLIANAAYRASLYEQIKRSFQRLAVLHKIELAISNNFNVKQIINTLLDQVVNQIHVDAADILLLAPGGLELIITDEKGFHSKEIRKKGVRVGRGLAGTSVLTKSIIYIANYPMSEDASDMQEILRNERIESYYAVPLIAKDVVKGVLEVFLRSHVPPDPDWLEFLQMLGSITAVAIDDAELFHNLQNINIELSQAYEATIEGWSHALDLRDRETEGHTQRVTELTVLLAQKMGFYETDLVHIRRGALLHDIGKMGIPDNILLKPSPLSNEEWEIMKKHPQYAYEMLSPIQYLTKALDIPYCHHERWDGTGYPRKLKGEEIPLTARVFSIVDVWDAITSDRPYRKAWSKEKAIEYILSGSDIQFDPKAVDVFIKMLVSAKSS